MLRPSRHVQFGDARIDPINGDLCDARVALKGAASIYYGRRSGQCVNVAALRSVADATTDALRGLGHAVEVDDLDVAKVIGEEVIAVRVHAHHDDETRTLLGFCRMGTEPTRAAVLAVLNATNRFLDIG